MCLDWPVGLQFAAFDLENEPTNSILQANFTCQLFLYNLQAKDGFDIFKWLGEKKKRKNNISWHEKLHENQISLPISEILLGHSHSFLYLWQYIHYI